MSKLIFVNPKIQNEFWVPNSEEGFSLIFDTQMPVWREKLEQILSSYCLSNCKLLCLYGACAKEAEDIADNWLVEPANEGLFFPTISNSDVDEIFYTIQSRFIVLLTSSSRLAQAFSEVEH